LNSKFFTRLNGSTTGTIEVVADVNDSHPSASRLVHVGVDQTSFFSLEVQTQTTLQWDLNGLNQTTIWQVDHDALNRAVFHLVFDSTQPNASDRAMLYVNGMPATVDMALPVLLNDTIQPPTDGVFAVGNREIGTRTIQGSIYYAAIYDSAFTPAEVAQNHQLLIVDDDGP
jgi:hypothetical protein